MVARQTDRSDVKEIYIERGEKEEDMEWNT